MLQANIRGKYIHHHKCGALRFRYKAYSHKIMDIIQFVPDEYIVDSKINDLSWRFVIRTFNLTRVILASKVSHLRE